MKRIGFVLSRFPKPSETFIERELSGLQTSGLDFEVFPLRRKPGRSLEGGAQALEPRVHRVRLLAPRVLAAHLGFLLRRPGRYLGAWAAIPRWHPGRPRDAFNFVTRFFKSVYFARRCQRTGIEHVHAQFATHAATAAFAIHRLTGIPFSFTAHAFDIYVHQAFLREKLEAASFVVTISRKNAEFLRRLAPRSDVHVVHVGIPLDRFAPKQDYVTGLRVFTAARLVPKKGLDGLLEACAELRRRGKAFELRIAGDGPLRSGLESRARELGIADSVAFLGFVPQSEVRARTREADLVVLPCEQRPGGDQDGIPTTLIESLALGVPVVSTPVSGIPELVTDGVEGLLVPPRDPRALAEAMLRLAGDADLQRRMGQAGKRKIREGFDLASTCGQLRRLLLEAGPE